MDIDKNSAVTAPPPTDDQDQMDVDNFQLQETPSPRNVLKAEHAAPMETNQKSDEKENAKPAASPKKSKAAPSPKKPATTKSAASPKKVKPAPARPAVSPKKAKAAQAKVAASPKKVKSAPSPKKSKAAASPKKAKPAPAKVTQSPKKAKATTAKPAASPKKAKQVAAELSKKAKTASSPKKSKPADSPKKAAKQAKVAQSPKKTKAVSTTESQKTKQASDKGTSGKSETKKRRTSTGRKRSRSNSCLTTPNTSRSGTPSKKRKRGEDSAQGTPKGILKKRDTPPKCTTEEVKHSVERKRSLETLIESPALFDREYIRKATKDELLTACGPAGLLPKHSERTCKNLRTALETTRQEIIKNIELDKPVLLLKNMGKHTFYRVSVHRVESPGGGEADASRQFELRCEWGATGMKKPSKFESDTSLKLQAPKTQTQSKFFATKEEAWNEARKIIEAKDKKRGYYVSMADNLAGVDEHKQVEVSERKINFAKKAIVQPFYGSEKPKKATKLRTSTAPAKK